MSGNQEDEHIPSRSPTPASPFSPSSSSTTDFVPFLSDSSESEGHRRGGSPLRYADGPIIMLSLPDDCPSPLIAAGPIEPDLAQFLFGEMLQREAAFTDCEVESARPSAVESAHPSAVESAHPSAVVLSAGAVDSELVGVDANPGTEKEITVNFEAGQSKKSPLSAQKKSGANSFGEAAAAGSSIGPGFHLEPGKEATEQTTLHVSGADQPVMSPMPADQVPKRVFFSKRCRRAKIRSLSSSPEPSLPATDKGKSLARSEAKDDDSSKNSHEELTIKRVGKEDSKNKGSSFESLNCQEGEGYPRNVFDALHMICRGREPDRRFEGVDILEIASMKGLDISMTPKWWRPGGYDTPMPKKNCNEGD